MKYIITKDEEVYIFEDEIRHSVFARRNRITTEIKSAGFVQVSYDGGVKCYGKSASTGHEPEKGDDDLISDKLYKLNKNPK